MLITEAVTEVRNNIKRQSQAFSDARIRQALSWAQRNIEALFDFPEMVDIAQTVTTAERAFINTIAAFAALGTPLKNIMGIDINYGGSDVRSLSQMPHWDFNRGYPEVFLAPTSFLGKPSIYSIQGQDIYFFKVPDIAYVLKINSHLYSKDFTETSLETYMLKKYSQMLVAAATSYVFLNLRELEDANYWNDQVFIPAFRIATGGVTDTRDWFPQARGFRSSGFAGSNNRFDPINPWSGGSFGPS